MVIRPPDADDKADKQKPRMTSPLMLIFVLLVWLAHAGLASGCAADRPGPPQPPEDAGDPRVHHNQALVDAGATGFTDVALPCEGPNYVELESGDLLAYTVQIHSENTDLTDALATSQRETASAMTEVLRAYTCERLMAPDAESIEEQLLNALEQRYLEQSGEQGVIDTLQFLPESCV